MKKLMMMTVCMVAAVSATRAETPMADGGVQAVMTAQNTSVPEQPPALTAKEKVEQALDKAFGGRTWKTKSAARKISVVDVPFQMVDPSRREDFFALRDTLVKRALLLAKVQIAESISVEAEGTEELDTNAGDKVGPKFVSGLKLAAKDPTTVFGMTVLAQAESWKDGVYHVALAVVWSENLKNAAAASLTNDKAAVRVDEAGAADFLANWLSKQNLGTCCGPRQVITPDGERHYLGISAREIGSNSEASSVNVRLAQLSAIQSLLFSLYADVSFQDVAEGVLETVTAGGVNGMTKGEATETLERQLSAKAKKVLRGLDEIYGDEVVHPITGRKMYVSVYELAASKAARAKALQIDIAALRAKAAQVDAADRAFNQGLQDAIRNAAQDTQHANEARQNAHRAVDARVKPESLLPKPAAPAKRPETTDKPQAREGVFGGDAEIKTDIL